MVVAMTVRLVESMSMMQPKAEEGQRSKCSDPAMEDPESSGGAYASFR